MNLNSEELIAWLIVAFVVTLFWIGVVKTIL